MPFEKAETASAFKRLVLPPAPMKDTIYGILPVNRQCSSASSSIIPADGPGASSLIISGKEGREDINYFEGVSEPMEPSRVEAVKNAIRANFDASPQNYDEFEEASGLFAFLARELASSAGVADGNSVLDVGCGTGISTLVLLDIVGPVGHATGIDISPRMLDLAVKRGAGHSNVDFVVGDAGALNTLLAPRTFDAILYNACVFLLPDAAESLKSAYRILKPGGLVAMNHIGGAFVAGRELFTELFPEWAGGQSFPAPRFPADIAGLENMVTLAGFSNVRKGTVEKTLPLDHLQRFYQVPAQSASLYPKLALAERRAAVEKMFAIAHQKDVKTAQMRWKWITGKK
jgi:ubiquinone/menaquinone biosynthesis C-methylase UbiE